MAQLTELKPIIRLYIENPESQSGSLFGKGIYSLCKGVHELGSLNAAAKSMGMAYSKAWRIIKETEAALDMQLLNRYGAHGSTLTDEGLALVNVYKQTEKALQEASQDIFLKQVS